MAIVAGATIAGVVAGVGAGITAGTIATGVIVGAVQFGVTLISSLLARRNPPRQSTPEDFANPVTVKSSISPVKIIYGEAIVGGTLVYSNVSGDDNKYLHLVIALAGHEVAEIGDVYINDLLSTDESIRTFVRAKKYLGEKYQLVDTDLASDFPQWTENHRLQGVAYIYLRIEQDYSTWNGIPNVKAVVKGRKVVNQSKPNYTKTNTLVCNGDTSFSFERQTQTFGGLFGVNFKCVLSSLVFDTGFRFYAVGDESKPENGAIYYDLATQQLRFLSFTGDEFALFAPLPEEGSQIHINVVIGFQTIALGLNEYSTIYNTGLQSDKIARMVDIVNTGVSFQLEKLFIATASSNFEYLSILEHDQTITGGILENNASRGNSSVGNITVSGDVTTQLIETGDPERWFRCWTKNPALNIQDYLTNSWFGLGVSWDQIDVAGFALAWQICGQSVPSNFNPCPRPLFTLDGVVDTSRTLGDNINNMLTSCGGVITWADGRYNLIVSAPASTVSTITSDDISSVVSFQISKDKSQVLNSVKAVYLSRERLWLASETPIYTDEQAVIDDGGEILTELNLPYTDNVHSARRLSQIYLNLSRLESTLTLRTKWNHTTLRAMDVVVVDNPETGINSEKFRVASWNHIPATLDDAGGIQLQLTQYDDDAYTFEETEDEIIIIPKIITPVFELSPPENFTARSDSTTATSIFGAVVNLNWSAVQSSVCIGYTIKATIHGGDSYEYEIGGPNTTLQVDPRPNAGDVVTYSIRSRGTNGIVSVWVTITHTVSDGDAVPLPPTEYRVLNSAEYEQYIGGASNVG